MKKFQKYCGFVLACTAVYIILNSLIYLVTGDFKEFDWLDKIISGLGFSIIFLLMDIYMEKHNLK